MNEKERYLYVKEGGYEKFSEGRKTETGRAKTEAKKEARMTEKEARMTEKFSDI